MSRANLGTSLRRRGRADRVQAMARHDGLPPELRQWLQTAALPWSAASALRLWRRALRDAPGDTARALTRLRRCEARLLAKDARGIWGAQYPQDAQPH